MDGSIEKLRKYEPIFGSYYISEKLGRGSFGEVFEIVKDSTSNPYPAALKVISIPQNSDEIKMKLSEGTSVQDVSSYYGDVLKEILQEIDIMYQLKGNSNIVSYEDHQVFPHEDGVGYDILVKMEKLVPLTDRIRSGSMPEKDVIKLGMDICKALDQCHRRNIIHRDIKPQNIFLTDTGDFKLGDFGIARTIEKSNEAMSRKGTYKYMAPEVYRGDDYDTTADIYSLGMVMYSLLNGNRSPFLPLPPERVTPDAEETARNRRFRGEKLPAPANAGVVMSKIIGKALEFEPSKRYSKAVNLGRDLERLYNNYEKYTGSMAPLKEEPKRKPAANGQAGPVPRSIHSGFTVPTAPGASEIAGAAGAAVPGYQQPVIPQHMQQPPRPQTPYVDPEMTATQTQYDPYGGVAYPGGAGRTGRAARNNNDDSKGGKGRTGKNAGIVAGVLIAVIVLVAAAVMLLMHKNDPEIAVDPADLHVRDYDINFSQTPKAEFESSGIDMLLKVKNDSDHPINGIDFVYKQGDSAIRNMKPRDGSAEDEEWADNEKFYAYGYIEAGETGYLYTRIRIPEDTKKSQGHIEVIHAYACSEQEGYEMPTGYVTDFDRDRDDYDVYVMNSNGSDIEADTADIIAVDEQVGSLENAWGHGEVTETIEGSSDITLKHAIHDPGFDYYKYGDKHTVYIIDRKKLDIDRGW